MTNDDVAADVEFFMPFYVLPSAVEDSRFPVRSISAGIAIQGPATGPIGKTRTVESWPGSLQLSHSVTARMTERYHRTDSRLETLFDKPVIR